MKPANIKVRSDGVVKVLDFGLAKALAPASADVPSLTAISTEVDVDHGDSRLYESRTGARRSRGPQADIWSFGVVLYELVTGARCFAGDDGRNAGERARHAAGLLGFPSDTPADVRNLVRRCLEKDRKRRLQHMGDVRIEVEEALAALRTQSTVDDDGPRVVGAWPAPRRLAAQRFSCSPRASCLQDLVNRREQELEGIKTLMRDASVRLLTLTGAGGSGKTRLAIEAAGI